MLFLAIHSAMSVQVEEHRRAQSERSAGGVVVWVGTATQEGSPTMLVTTAADVDSGAPFSWS